MACVNVTSQGAREESHSHLPVDVLLVLFLRVQEQQPAGRLAAAKQQRFYAY
jgi:hypothetical protein